MENKSKSKSKYEEIVLPNFILIQKWARCGETEKGIAKRLGIAYSTFKAYKNKHEALMALLKKTREVVDTEVENALLENAKGFYKTVQKAIKVKQVWHDNNGKRCEKEAVEVVDVQEYFRADVGAQCFWLKNRLPDIWRERQAELPKTDEADKRLKELVAAIKGIAKNEN